MPFSRAAFTSFFAFCLAVFASFAPACLAVAALIFLVPFLPDGEPDGLCAAAVGAAASCDRPPFVVGSSMPSIGRKVTARSGKSEMHRSSSFAGEHVATVTRDSRRFGGTCFCV